MTTPGVPTITRHTIISLGPPGPRTTIQNTESCTQTVNSLEYGYGCVSSPTCASPMVLSTDTATSLYGVPLLICVSSTSGSIQPGGPISPASLSTIMSSSNPGGLMSSATVMTSTSVNPGGPMSSVASPSSTVTVQPGGPLSSKITSSGISPSGIASVSLQHTSLTEPLSTVSTSRATSGTSAGTSTSSSTSPTASGSGAIGINDGLGQSPLVGLVMMCWMGVWGWRALRGRL